MRILIDGDSILYRVAFRGEELGDDEIVRDGFGVYTIGVETGSSQGEEGEIRIVDTLDITANSAEEAEAEYAKQKGLANAGYVKMFNFAPEDDGLGDMTEESPEYAFSGDHKLHLPSSYEAIDWAIKEIAQSWVLELLTEDDKTIEGIEIHMTGKDGRAHCDGLKGNFRFDYVEDYKSDRKDSRPPAGLPELWAHIFTITEVDGLPVKVYVVDGAEADDTVVFLKKTYPTDFLIAALDKDVLYQSVGRHYNYGKKEFVEVTADEARTYLFFQMIAGDPSDGYKGVPGVGKVGANKALKNQDTDKAMWDTTLALYKKKGLGLGECLQTGILASMHQVVEIEYKGNWITPTIEVFKAVK